VAALLLAGCKLPSFGAYQSDTETGRSTYHLWQGFSVAAAIIGGFTILLIVWTVLRYRRRSVDAVPRQVQYHIPLEILYTIIPILIVVGLFAATVVVENKVEAMPQTNVVIKANAFQWGWGFTYPGHNAIAVGNTTETPTMVMPVNTNVRVILTSTDVVHGFYIRDFNFSRYALPGVTNEFTFRAQNTGTFWGQCSQLCGLYHTIMFFKVKVVTPAQYGAWLQSFETPAGKAAAAAAAAALKQQLSAHVPVTPYVGKGVN
jgi:cytochrome c oxidase subunit 2